MKRLLAAFWAIGLGSLAFASPSSSQSNWTQCNYINQSTGCTVDVTYESATSNNYQVDVTCPDGYSSSHAGTGARSSFTSCEAEAGP